MPEERDLELTKWLSRKKRDPTGVPHVLLHTRNHIHGHRGEENYIMSIPPMPPPGIPAGALSFSGLSATTDSVVKNRAATEAAF